MAPKASQRRAQPCTAVRRRNGTASSRAMSFSMQSLALGDRAQRIKARRKRSEVHQIQASAPLVGAQCIDDVWEGLRPSRLVLPYKSYQRRCSSTSSHPHIVHVAPHTCHVSGAQQGPSGTADTGTTSHARTQTCCNDHGSGLRSGGGAALGRKAVEGGQVAS